MAVPGAGNQSVKDFLPHFPLIQMSKLYLRKIKASDKIFFSKWWRDEELIKLTSGILKPLSNKEVEEYFSALYKNKRNRHFIITLNQKAIGHISLVERKNNWHETQIIIGEKRYWGKGYGTKAIQSLIKRAKRFKISKIYLEVRPNNIRAINAYEKCGFYKIRIKKYSRNKFLPETLRMELKPLAYPCRGQP